MISWSLTAGGMSVSSSECGGAVVARVFSTDQTCLVALVGGLCTENLRAFEAKFVQNNADRGVMLDATHVIDPLQVFHAVTRAVIDYEHGVMKTHTLHESVAFMCSSLKHIDTALRKMTLRSHSARTDCVGMIVIVADNETQVRQRFAEALACVNQAEGSATVLPLAQVADHCDVASIKKMFQIMPSETDVVRAVLNRVGSS